MTRAGEIGIEERISMIRTEYFFQRIDLEYDECGWPKVSPGRVYHREVTVVSDHLNDYAIGLPTTSTLYVCSKLLPFYIAPSVLCNVQLPLTFQLVDRHTCGSISHNGSDGQRWATSLWGHVSFCEQQSAPRPPSPWCIEVRVFQLFDSHILVAHLLITQ